MADLGFDFADDHDEYETFEDESIVNEMDDIPTGDDAADDAGQSTHGAPVESDRLVSPDRLLEAPEEGYDGSSLLSTMLAEAPQDDLDTNILETETLTPIECIRKYGQSNDMIHRQLIAKDLPIALYEAEVDEAVDELLPLVYRLAYDEDDTVRETFASELDKIILYFYRQAPPILTDEATSDSSRHIPPKTFSRILIHLLLDQYSNVAALGQQCIVSVTAELMGTEAAFTTLDHQLIQIDIFQGVVLGLMDIISGKRRPPSIDDFDQDTSDQKNTDDHLSANLSATSLASPTTAVPPSTTGVLRRSSATPGFESSFMAPTTEELDQGEINLAKMMCLSLLSSLIPVLGPERATEDCLPIVEQLAQDAMFFVRKEAAVAIGSLANVVDPQVALDRLLPLYSAYTRDSIWHVRCSCLLTLPLLCGVLDDETKAQLAVEAVEMFKNDVSRNVRNTLAEVIGELITKFLPDDWETTGTPGKVPEPLLEFFLSLGASSNSNQMFKLETDRALICAYNFPAVVVTAGADFWDSHLKETYLGLTKDYQIKVRRTFAYSLHEIARIIGSERTERDLVQIFALYLMDLDDVKQGVMEHLADFLGTLAVSSRNEYIPILIEVWDGVMTNWRLRDTLAAQLREIALLFDAARVVEHILPLAIRGCHDEFATVRQTAVEAFPVILDIVKRAVDEGGENLSHDGDMEDEEGDDPEDQSESKRNFALALLNHVMECLDEFVRSKMYRDRLTFTLICRALLDMGISAGDFASFFLPRLKPLTEDPVVNVRIGASRTLRQIYTNESYRQELVALNLCDDGQDDDPDDQKLDTLPGQLMDQLLYRLALDADVDVRLYVLDLVDPDRLEAEEQAFQLAASTAPLTSSADKNEPLDNPTPALSNGSFTAATDQQPSDGHRLMRKILNEDTSIDPDQTINDIDENNNNEAPMDTDEQLRPSYISEPVDEAQPQNAVDPKDEDGDALMTEADQDDDDSDDDAPPPSQEKSEFIYLSKSPQDTVADPSVNNF
ncbi:ARM repeat-containing protein [Hesseltinella vesiculosa]|uniref:ARM repeat-containing protein n=1 Tax=Hesseltinella vesiculosa TaxID=101127 RepID=A0A1X2GD03_9FUNG|nr:ARM repeat-containing protein [Hesseltinella vesiculosa]